MKPAGLTALATLAAAATLSACAATGPSTGAPGAAAHPLAAAAIGQRDLTPAEKKIVTDAVGLSLVDPKSARYHWTKFPDMTAQNSVNYCATVDGKSPYPAYNGRQAYIVETKVLGGRVISATMGLIAGGKDAVLVAKMCAKYDLDPNKAM
ncbi:MAG TPA: hypothetical protein VIJ04_14905 [Xanthobacteraceae bacterium]